MERTAVHTKAPPASVPVDSNYQVFHDNEHRSVRLPHCIDEFAFDYQKIAKLTYGWRVRVRCPGCGSIVEVVMLAYTVIHGCDCAPRKPRSI